MRFGKVRGFLVCLWFVFILFSSICVAQDRHDSSSYPHPLTGPLAQSHIGTSPFPPPAKNDQTFFVDAGTGLDTGCTFRSGGPLVITFKVDRVVTNDANVPNGVARLKANGMISETATLEMPAYDVDYDAVVSGINPERDQVTFNGHVVPSEWLTGLNDTWIMNRFDVPIEWVNFPSDPGAGNAVTPVDNVVQIDIDTANTAEDWCTSIDWVSLGVQVARPVVMVHGIFSSGSTWSDLWVPNLNALGLPNSNSLNMGNLDSISNNAAKISDEVDASRKRWGVDAVNLATHSKGGIDSRQYAEKGKTVEQLIQIGTPNQGSPLADLLEGTSLIFLGASNTLDVNELLGGPAGIELTQPAMWLYNRLHGHNQQITYTSLAGDYHPDCSADPADCVLSSIAGLSLHALFNLTPDPNDTVVPVSSVFSLPYSSHITYESAGKDGQARHACIDQLGSLLHPEYGCQTKSEDIFAELAPNVRMFGTPANSNARLQLIQNQEQSIRASAQRERAQSTKTVSQSSSVSTLPVRTFSNPGQIHQTEVKTGTIQVDSCTSAAFTLLYGSGTLDFSLTAPSGAAYTSAIGVSNPNATFADDAILGGRMAAYVINNPETGTWTYTVTGSSVTATSGMTGYAVDAWLNGTTVLVTGGFGTKSIHVGDPLLLEATATNGGSPLAGATGTAVVKLPDATTSTVTLFDDGTHGDLHSGDGVYSATFAQTSQSGNYQVVFQVKGTAPAFEREDYQLATVSSSSSSFSKTFTDAGVDTDSDGLYNSLKVTAGVTITKAANYRVYGEITDSKGNVLDTTTEANLSTSTNTVQLSFDGATLYQRGVDGPYTLSRVTMAEDDGSAIMPVDEQLNGYQTTAYMAAQFQHAGLAISGNGTANGIDLNSNQLYDQLVIDFDVTSAGSGYYYWSGRLSDKNGTEINLAANSGNLVAGTNTIEMVFDGKAIGIHGVNGPYQLNDLLLYGPGGSISVGHVLSTTAYLASQFEGYVALNPISTGVALALTGPASRTPTYGDTVSVTVLVQPSTGTGTPTGTTTFSIDGVAQSPISLVNSRGTFTGVLGGGKHTFTATYSGDTDYASSASSSSLVVDVAQAATTTSLAISASSVTIQDTATLTAQVTSSVAGTITGTVAFSKVNSDNTLSSLGTGTVARDNSGNYTATLPGQSLAIGTYSLLAAYSGDANYATSTSAKGSLIVTDKADLTVSNLPANINLKYGNSQSATAAISVVNGFRDPVTLACSGMPSDITCQIAVQGGTSGSTVTISPDSNGAYPSSIQLSVASTTKAVLESPARGNRMELAGLLPFLAVIFLLPIARMRRKLSSLFAMVALALAISVVTGCGGGGGGGAKTETASGTLAVTSSGTHPISHSYTFTVTVN